MMRYWYLLVIIALVGFTACDDFIVGKSIQLAGAGDAQFLINVPSTIVNVSDTIPITIFIHEYNEPVAGWQYTLNYQGVPATVGNINYLGFFPGQQNTNYFCVDPIDTSTPGVITNIACAGIQQTNTNYATGDNAHTIELTPTAPGTLTLSLTDLLLANTSGPPDFTGPIPLDITPNVVIEVCQDSDSDGYYTSANCGGPVDCQDNNPAINPGAEEICDLIDNDCDTLIDANDPFVASCSSFNPQINNLFFGNQDLVLSGIIGGVDNLSVDVTDISDIPGTSNGPSDLTQVEYFLDSNSLGVSTTGPNYILTNFDTKVPGDGQYTLSAIATDSLGYTGTISAIVDIQNDCSVQSFDWNTPFTVNEGDSLELGAIATNTKCAGRDLTILYEEIDGGISSPLDINALGLSYPSVISFSGVVGTSTAGIADWIKDDILEGGNYNPEIRARIVDDTGTTLYSTIITILNTPPVLSVGTTVDSTTATITATTSATDPSTYTLEIGTADGVYTTTINGPAQLGETHNFDLSSLNSLTTYYYRVNATDEGAAVVSQTGSFTTLRISADVTGPAPDFLPDGKVDINDLAAVASAFRSRPGDAGWNANYDIVIVGGEQIINILDLTSVAIAYTG